MARIFVTNLTVDGKDGKNKERNTGSMIEKHGA
jgi:hypothetical protein